MRDGGVAPVEQPIPTMALVDVRQVKVVVLDRLRHSAPRELGAKLREAWRERPQAGRLVDPEREVGL